MGIYRSLREAFLGKKNRTKLLLGFPEIEVGSPLFGCNHDVDFFGKTVLVQSKELSDESLDSIPFDGVSGSFARRDPQSGDAQPAPTHSDGKMVGMDPLAGAI